MKNGEWLKNARNLLGITQQQLCQFTNINYYTLQAVERGRRKGSKVFWETVTTYLYERRDRLVSLLQDL